MTHSASLTAIKVFFKKGFKVEKKLHYARNSRFVSR